MARQLGRRSSAERVAEDIIDDFEELVLSPRPVRRRSPSPVNMKRMLGRPEHAETTQQTALSMQAHDGNIEELDLDPSRGDRYLQRRPRFGDFGWALGRQGLDPRVLLSEPESDEALLTNYVPPFIAPPL
jgi:hypothetical protein